MWMLFADLEFDQMTLQNGYTKGLCQKGSKQHSGLRRCFDIMLFCRKRHYRVMGIVITWISGLENILYIHEILAYGQR